MKWLTAAVVLGTVATGASSCSTESVADQPCGEGKGHWIEDESDVLKGGYTVIVRICVDDGGNIIDLEVE